MLFSLPLSLKTTGKCPQVKMKKELFKVMVLISTVIFFFNFPCLLTKRITILKVWRCKNMRELLTIARDIVVINNILLIIMVSFVKIFLKDTYLDFNYCTHFK